MVFREPMRERGNWKKGGRRRVGCEGVTEAQQRVLTVHGVWVEFFDGVPDRIRPVEHRVWEGSRWEREVDNRWSASAHHVHCPRRPLYTLHSLLPSRTPFTPSFPPSLPISFSFLHRSIFLYIATAFFFFPPDTVRNG